MLDIDPGLFKKNLLLTQLYCDIQERNIVADEALTDVSSVLRSFIPEIEGKEVIEFGVEEFRTGNTINIELVKSMHWTIDPVTEEKYIDNFHRDQMAYKEEGLKGVSPDKKRYAGHIVVSKVDLTLANGKSAIESYYLYDHYDLPPIDTWFYLVNTPATRLLFAWMPDTYCGWAQNLIEVDRIECIGWFETVFPEDYKRLH